MATGLALPLRVGPTGGTIQSTGDEQSDKIIRLALSDGDNDNAFQLDITLGVGAVFKVANPGFRAQVLARLFRIFREFQARKTFTLLPNSIRWRRGKEGEQILSFRYKSLESDRVFEFEQSFGAGTGGL